MATVYFYHSSRGVWTTDGVPAQKYLDQYPQGTTVIPAPPGPNYQWDGSAWQPLPTVFVNADVNAERDRRVLDGSSFDIIGGLTIRLNGDAITTRNLQALAVAAQLRIGSGDTTTITLFRDADNVIHSLTPPQVLDLFSKASAFVEAVFQAGWTLKDNGIPADYTDDKYWP